MSRAADPVSPPEAMFADEERFRLVAEALEGFVYDADLRSGRVTRTDGMRRLLGWGPEEVPPTVGWWRAQIHPDDAARQAGDVERLLADDGGDTAERSYRVRHRDGRWIWVLDRTRLVRDASGRAVRMVGVTTDVTARREAERARVESETRLRLLIAQSPSSIHVVDVAGRTVHVNPAFEAMWGIGMAELEGYVLWDDPQLQANGLEPFVARARGGEVVRIPPYRHDPAVSVGQGTARWIEVTVYPVKDERGAVREIVMLHTDVTDREEAARRSARDNRRLAEVLEVSPVPLVQVGADGAITFANAAAARALGVGREVLVGTRYDAPAWGLTTLDGTPIPPGRTPVARALRGETVAASEVLVDALDGARRVMELHAAPLHDEGAVAGVIVAFEDVTLRHAAAEERERLLAAEQRAREEADRKRGAADFLAEASRLLSQSLDYEHALAALAALAVPALGDWCAVDMLEVPRDPVAPGEPAPDWPPAVRRLAVAHQDPAKVRWAWALAERAPQDWAAPTGMPRVLREGVAEFYPAIDDAMLVAAARTPAQLALLREIGFSAYICVPLVARGMVLGALTLGHAESGRHYDADDLALAEDLARRAAVAVDNARLYGDAVEANRAKSDFLAVMSHELRTPLNAILGYAGLLEAEVAGPLADGQRDFVARSRDAAHRLLTLVDDLLTFAKFEAGHVTVSLRPVGAGALVEQVVPLMGPQAAARGVQLVADLAPVDAALSVEADHERAVQVLLNLLGNAVKFTPPGGRVALTVHEPAPGLVHLAVTDTGIGIAPADLERVFEPFVQLEEGRTRTRGGTGLGLAISRDLARAMGGDVLADSTPGHGSTFTLALRRADDPNSRVPS